MTLKATINNMFAGQQIDGNNTIINSNDLFMRIKSHFETVIQPGLHAGGRRTYYNATATKEYAKQNTNTWLRGRGGFGKPGGGGRFGAGRGGGRFGARSWPWKW